MTPEQFIAKWKLSTLGERQAAQAHFLDLCALLDEAKPEDPDNYCFERGAVKSSGRRGWADVWKRGHFAWEYKGKGANLDDALAQLQQYALALENPPLLVVCDLERFLIVTNWTNTVSRRTLLRLEDLVQPAKREILKQVLSDPERLKPGLTREQITAERALAMAGLARDLRARGHHPELVAKFLVRLVFCMFAQGIALLPRQMLTRMLEAAEHEPDESESLAKLLFEAMAAGKRVGFERVRWFNGGLFETGEAEPLALPMDRPQLRAAKEAAERDWSEIDPSILGTLFVQSLDPKRMEDLFRSAGTRDFGAVTFRRSFEQYTDRDKIMKIVGPVIERPLAEEWAQARRRIEGLLLPASGKAPAPKARAEAEAIYKAHLDRLRAFRVLDPACGSGNFLFLALQTLKDLEWRAILDANQLGLHPEIPQVDPRAVLGIDLNPFAIQIARASVWIGHLQWYRHHGLQVTGEPILQPLDTIERRDALLNEDGSRARWPNADVIVGNPPFLGGKLLRDGLGDETVERMFAAYDDDVPREADLVCYWFAQARQAMERANCVRTGLVTTNSIRSGANRKVLDEIVGCGLVLFDAWDDEAWVVEGAAVRVSLVCFGRSAAVPETEHRLDGAPVAAINTDLTSGGTEFDLTLARPLRENRGVAFMGDTKGGAFDVPGELARQWLLAPTNPNRRPNSDVLCPWVNGSDITGRSRDMWIIDFGWTRTKEEVAYFELPYAWILKNVWSERQSNRRDSYRQRWWQHVEARPALRNLIKGMNRFLVTARVARYRTFAWLDARVIPDSRLIAFVRSDDLFFGIMHSRYHEIWSLRLGGWHGVGNDPQYTPSAGFETFPFPEGLTPNLPLPSCTSDPRAQRIADAAKRLHELRENWLNPPELVERVPEVVPGYPDRLLPRDEAAAQELKKRTLTNLYNQRPAWLDHLHRELDAAVAAAYGWPADLSDDAILKRLFDLNQERAKAAPVHPDR